MTTILFVHILREGHKNTKYPHFFGHWKIFFKICGLSEYVYDLLIFRQMIQSPN